MRHPLFLAAAMALAFASSAPAHDGHHDPIGAAIAGTVRSDADRLRDKYRHPAETLAFFDVRPGQTVVEFLPGGGWYTKILAPLLKGKGRYIALVPDDPRAKEADKALARKVIANDLSVRDTEKLAREAKPSANGSHGGGGGGGRDADIAAALALIGPPPSRARPPGFSSLLRAIVAQQVSAASAAAGRSV